MQFYHITREENVQSILDSGLHPSKSGLDGPGVYLWKGPLSSAISEADLSLSDNHFQMTESEYSAFKKQLAVLAVTLPLHSTFSAEFPEYVVYSDNISASCIAYCGSFFDLVESCNQHSFEPLDEMIQSASIRAVDSHSIDISSKKEFTPEH